MSKIDNIWEPKDANKEMLVSSKEKNPSASSFDLDIRRIIGLWPFILLFGLLGYALGSVYLRYVTPIYTVSSAISFDDNSNDLTLGKVLFGSNKDPLNDKIAYLKSPTLASKIIDSLGLQYHAESQGRFKNKDFYGIIKWKIIKENEEDIIPEINFSIVPDKEGFVFSYGNVKRRGKWGEPFSIKKELVIIDNPGNFYRSSPIFCNSIDKTAMAFTMSNNLQVSSSKTDNVLTLKYTDLSDQRAVDILNKLIQVYNDDLKINKSLGLSQAIDFIEKRMEPLKLELDSIENSLAAFKASNNITTNIDGNAYNDEIAKYDDQMRQINILELTIKEIEDFIYHPQFREEQLSYSGIDNPALQALCTQFQQLRIQRDKLALTAQETNPQLIFLNKNLSDLRTNMNEELSNYKRKLQYLKTDYQNKVAIASGKLKNIPFLQKELIDKSRFQDIKQALYTTLLQKREEAYIAKASVTPDTKIIYAPLKSSASVKPSYASILSFFILAGLLLPIIFAIILEISNKKIISKKQLQTLSTVPVVAEIEQISQSEFFPFVVDGGSRSMFGEQIRSLRTNINFYTDKEDKTNYIILTSSVSGEGKSFLSMNLAKSYSLQGKKVALLEFDLRRPKIAKALGKDNVNVGLSSLLSGKLTPADIIIPIVNTEEEHLDLFPSGAIPPNPQELLSSKNMSVLKEYLDKNYDVVVVDTPPFGIVADAQILGQWADITLIITRFNQTVKDQVIEINDWKEKNYFNSMAIVFNGVKNSGYFGYKYGYYYYKRKYGYNYYSGYTGYTGYTGYISKGKKKSKEV